MSKEKLTNQLKNAYKQLEEEFKNKGRPNTIEDNNVDYDNCNIYAMRQKISDLEAKLAESERQYQEYRQIVEKDIEKEVDERMRDTIKEFNFDISQLKQQLAESEEENETFRKALQGEIFINYKIPMENERLKQQLAEKEEKFQNWVNSYFDSPTNQPVLTTSQHLTQAKTDFAIEQLEQMKEKLEVLLKNTEKELNSITDFEFHNKVQGSMKGYMDSINIIDQQIQELRG